MTVVNVLFAYIALFCCHICVFGNVVSGVNLHNYIVENQSFSNTNLTDSGHCLVFLWSTDVTIRNCTFTNCAGFGVWLSDTVGGLIENCVFSNSSGGIFASDSKSVRVLRNVFGTMNTGKGIDWAGQFVYFLNVSIV